MTLGGVVTVSVVSNPDEAKLVLLCFSTIDFFRMYLYEWNDRGPEYLLKFVKFET